MNNNVKVARKLVTPELASKYLSSNQGNRKISQGQINFYYKQMVSGEWGATGDTIKISTDGRLLDGQHRLHALVRYDKPIEMFIAEGVDPEMFPMIDTGKPRTASDVLSSTGVAMATAMASAAKHIMLYSKDDFKSGKRKENSPSHKKILDFVRDNPELETVVEYAGKITHKFRMMPHYMLSTLYWITSRNNRSKAADFISLYGSGIDLDQNSPIRLLRERLIMDKSQHNKLSVKDKAALYIMCWNLFVTGKTQVQLRLQKNYVFPKPL